MGQVVVDAGVEITRLRAARGALHVDMLRHVAEMDRSKAWRLDATPDHSGRLKESAYQ